MSDTIGQLIDKLMIVNLKTWHAQDAVYKAAAQPLEEYALRDPQETQEVFKKVASLNLDRNTLIREIDERIAEAVATGQVQVASNIKYL